MTQSPSGKARVCKTLIRRFNSALGLPKTFCSQNVRTNIRLKANVLVTLGYKFITLN